MPIPPVCQLLSSHEKWLDIGSKPAEQVSVRSLNLNKENRQLGPEPSCSFMRQVTCSSENSWLSPGWSGITSNFPEAIRAFHSISCPEIPFVLKSSIWPRAAVHGYFRSAFGSVSELAVIHRVSQCFVYSDYVTFHIDDYTSLYCMFL